MSELADKLRPEIERLKDAVVDNVIMLRIANKGIAIIRKRTLKGEFLPGSSPNASQYSTTPLPLPLGKFTRETQRQILSGKADLGENFRLFTNRKTRNVWIVIQGGYKKFRELAGKPTDNVVMTWSGRMMRNLGIIRSTETEATLGFSDQGSRQIAEYHNVLGAGKSRRKHIFMGFEEKELKELAKLAGEEIAKKLSGI